VRPAIFAGNSTTASQANQAQINPRLYPSLDEGWGSPSKMEILFSSEAKALHSAMVSVSLPTIEDLLSSRFIPRLLFVVIIFIGVFARVWQFGQLPPGLNQDEASIGVEAYDLFYFGVGRNGFSYPVNFVAWGTGQNTLYAYLLVPFVALGGLTPMMVRLPMLIAGILTLPLVFFVATCTLGNRFGLLGMFFLAISPWHIVLSRWGLESNLLPFVFLLGYACLLKSTAENYWLIAAALFFALSLYAYGTAYAAVPIFFSCAVALLVFSKRVNITTLILSLAVLFIIGSPIILLVWINTFGLETIHIGAITIPRLPMEARFHSEGAVFNKDIIMALFTNTRTMLDILWRQTDGLVWNTVEPYGYFYTFTFPLAVLGVLQAFPFRKGRYSVENALLLCWIATSVIVGALQPTNINRLNLIFIPLILFIAVPLFLASKHSKIVLAVALAGLFFAFLRFTQEYHGKAYQETASTAFYPGLIPALEFARARGDNPICVTDHVNMPYIFVLFADRLNPENYLRTMRYTDDAAVGIRQVTELERYTFGAENCPADPHMIYVLARDEEPPPTRRQKPHYEFGAYHVYTP
jgi:hypothetical protein